MSTQWVPMGTLQTYSVPLPAAMPPLSLSPGDTTEPGGREQPGSGNPVAPCKVDGFSPRTGDVPSFLAQMLSLAPCRTHAGLGDPMEELGGQF